MKKLLLLSLGLLSLFWACKPQSPTTVPGGTMQVILTNLPSEVTDQQIYLGDSLLPKGTRLTKQKLPTGERLLVELPAGKTLPMRLTDGKMVASTKFCYACDCNGTGSCEVAIFQVMGGSFGFLQGTCDAEVIGFNCEE
jgi:hypothetical protein